jgi:hypothetical protein
MLVAFLLEPVLTQIAKKINQGSWLSRYNGTVSKHCKEKD